MPAIAVTPPMRYPYERDYSATLEAAGLHLLAMLAEEPDAAADRVAASGLRPPDGEGWHGWPRLRVGLLDALEFEGSESYSVRLPHLTAWYLARRGLVEVATTPRRGGRGQLRYVRIARTGDADAPPPVATPLPASDGPPVYPTDNDDRLASVGEVILQMLTEPVDADAHLAASCGRIPPRSDRPGWPWWSWAYLAPLAVERCRLPGGRRRTSQVVTLAAWRLFRLGEVELAVSPHGSGADRIRHIRRLASLDPHEPAPLWPLPFRVRAEAPS